MVPGVVDIEAFVKAEGLEAIGALARDPRCSCWVRLQAFRSLSALVDCLRARKPWVTHELLAWMSKERNSGMR